MLEESEEIVRHRKMANDGWVDSMYWLASAILISDSSANRGVEAAQWLFLSIFLGSEKSKAPLEFINSTLKNEEFEIAYKNVLTWIDERFLDFENNKDISNWSSELYKLVKEGDDYSKRKAKLKLVWSKD